MKAASLAAGILAAAALAACGTSGGGPRAEPVRALMSADVMVFVSFDADGDLSVTEAEMNAGLPREFSRADTNGDGQLQPIEFQNWANAALGGGQIGPFRLDFDRNVDNLITREEFEAEFRARFSDYDTDENGAISRPEFVRLVGQARPPRQPRLVDGRPND
ncbi:MAG TPA: hypothetical protein PLK37_05610 [Terricaulis sp.]|nr:hypothetical protein [Terricaulis sp.]